MSIESWKAEFYPIPADEVPINQAIAHSLRKWEGLRKENLDRHELIRIGRWLRDERRYFAVDGESCALCHHYLVDDNVDNISCDDCPLSIERDGVACDKLFNNEEVSPWSEFEKEGNPEPMIFWLKAAQAKIEPDSTA